MLKLTQNILNKFSIRLKGPTKQRQAIRHSVSLQVPKMNEDYFAQYYQNTLQLYKNGFSPEQLESSTENVKRLFRLQNATPSEILKFRKEQAIKKYQIKPSDVGSAGVQVAMMSEQVILSMYHCKKYPKDVKAARFLTIFLDKRRKMLEYLYRTDYHRYKWICTDYGIPDIPKKTVTHQTQFFILNKQYRL